MPRRADPVLTAAQMRAAEERLIAAGTSVDALMLRAGQGAAEYVWRISGGRPVTVLCGPGNNGGDGYVIAQALSERGGEVVVIAAAEPATDAAKAARAAFEGPVVADPARCHGDVLVDCLFGTGLSRPLSAYHSNLLAALSRSHSVRVAVDLPSGIDSDSGALLNDELASRRLTIALGAWKPAHFLMPAGARMGALRLVDIGVTAPPGCATLLERPILAPPEAHAHKYTRGLLAVIAGSMPGASALAARAAQHAGAGYVKLLAAEAAGVPADLVADQIALEVALADRRLSALLVGPGLGRHAAARTRLELALAAQVPLVIDADALVLLGPADLAGGTCPLVVTPHEGEMQALEKAFGCAKAATKPDRAKALANALNAVVVAKGPDTVIAAPDGRVTFTAPASSWLSTAGTGDVLAGIIASRLASGAEAFGAACQGVWLHGEAARVARPAFTAGQLAECVQAAYAACL